jgi:amino acid transporter
MYVCMFSAAIHLRRKEPDRERPIRIPGLPVVAVVGILAAISAIVLGLTPPSGYTSTPVPVYAAIVATGVSCSASHRSPSTGSGARRGRPTPTPSRSWRKTTRTGGWATHRR